MNEMNLKNIENNAELTNKLLVELIKNQKQNTNNMIKMFFATVVCMTVLLLGMIIGFFIYESQFETTSSDFEYQVEQEAESEDGNAINNFGGDVNYGSLETDDKGKGSDDNKIK